MSWEIFASPGKGRTAVDTDKVAAIIDRGADSTDTNTVIMTVTGTEIPLGTKFKTVLKKFTATEDEDEE